MSFVAYISARQYIIVRSKAINICAFAAMLPLLRLRCFWASTLGELSVTDLYKRHAIINGMKRERSSTQGVLNGNSDRIFNSFLHVGVIFDWVWNCAWNFNSL